MKKKLKYFVLIMIIFVFGFAGGIYFISKDHFTAYSLKKVMPIGENYIEFQGEMVALDFNSAYKIRTISGKCLKTEAQYKICTWSEFTVFNSSNSGSMHAEIIENDSFQQWNKNRIIAISNNTNYTRTFEIDLQNKAITETYKFQNGEIRTLKLVDSFEKLGAAKRL